MSQASRGKLGGLPGMPSMPGMPGAMGKKSKGKQGKKGKARGARSGNPAKRAAQLAAAEDRRTAAPKPGEVPAAFGGGADDVGEFELPADVTEFLKNR
jgi:signal recognition particle subunit SRP54